MSLARGDDDRPAEPRGDQPKEQLVSERLVSERLVSELVLAEPGSFDASAMAAGAPGVPRAFAWRGKTYRVSAILETRKSLRGCHSGSGEQYINKHYYTVATESGEIMTLYRTRSGSKKDGWVLYTLRVTGDGRTNAEGDVPMRIAVLVSGGGTNLQALIDAQEADRRSAGTGTSARATDAASEPSAGGEFEIAVVIADRDCYALERARKSGIPTKLVAAPKGVDRAAARRIVSDGILALLREYRADAVVLAGFLTIMSGDVIAEYSSRIVNLHPALLPKFGGPGMWGHHVHEAVLASGDAESGCTVHLVDAGCDTGPILLQKRVPVLAGDTAETLAARISGSEHEAIVEGVRLLAKRWNAGLAGKVSGDKQANGSAAD
jgi:phosphoribosylglycinamide formyltransferase-1